MGSIFGKKKEIYYVTELIRLSNGSLTDDEIYDTTMKSNCNSHTVTARELVFLFKVFTELDEPIKGLLSNRQLLTLPEFQFHPFRFRLKYALNTRPDEYISKMSSSLLVGPHEPQVLSSIPASANSKVHPEEHLTPPLLLINNESELFTSIDEIPYIDFKLFCIYLTPFCLRTPIDIKVSFMFRLYDFDEDGAISKEDLTAAINMLVQGRIAPKSTEEVIENIFEEIAPHETEKTTIDKDEFQKVLWVTDFDQKMNLYF